MLIAGYRIWAEIVNANCSRASNRTSFVSSIRPRLLRPPYFTQYYALEKKQAPARPLKLPQPGAVSHAAPVGHMILMSRSACSPDQRRRLLMPGSKKES